MTTTLERTALTDDRLTDDRLTDDLLTGFRERAARHDATGTYATDDLAALRAAGWLKAALPADRGGRGLDLAALAAEQRRMARFSPATALSTCMHHYWVGTAADLAARGVDAAEPVLRWTAEDRVLASGHAEAGNDVPVALSTTRATRVRGGWRIDGRKMFGSLGEHWDLLGVHAMDSSDPAAPVVVHGFVPRGAAGLRTVRNWDAQGMRATESHDTVLDGVFLADADVLRTVPAGPSDDPVVGTMQVWALTLIANVYVGVAERALELAVAHARTRTSIALPRGTFAHHPLVQHQVAAMHLELSAARAQLDALARDWVSGVDHGPMWGVHVLSAKWRATRAATSVVDTACEVVGGASYRAGTELERLSRDVRAARFHPGTDAFTHEMVGKALLGVDPTGPRW
ncbi:acyl-CoA dehydrogenase family protein [Pseudonocardia sp. RS010]|uniref:acyl-CoA dehydrogenase family protein n=1 Tax=Pseudonocardia sp. RS010 TaxID=3385979 RepID=UPI0039A16FAB